MPNVDGPPLRPLPRYQQASRCTFVLGHFAVQELLTHAASEVVEVRFHQDLPQAQRQRLAAHAVAAGILFRRDDAAVRGKRSKGTAQVLAVVRKAWRTLAPGRPHLALVATREAGNLGTALRSAGALGVRDVALIGPVDPWSPHALRASAGIAFALRLQRFEDLTAYREAHPERTPWLMHGGADLTAQAAAKRAAAEAAAGRPYTLAAGPEWPGFDAATLQQGRAFRIATDPLVESLNVAVAIGIALHAFRSAMPAAPEQAAR